MNILLENLDLFTIRIIISQKIKYIYIKIIKIISTFWITNSVFFLFYFILRWISNRIRFEKIKNRENDTKERLIFETVSIENIKVCLKNENIYVIYYDWI